ncbi:MAG: glycosyltransferase family 2 protein [Mycetocola sp.]
MQHLAVVMPAYNEADGLPGFLDEILEHVSPLADRVSIVVVNDRSTDETASVLAALAEQVPQLVVVDADVNRGHGPSALAAYRAGLALGPDAIVHVDGDGQFIGTDFPRLLLPFDAPDVDVVHGVRQNRSDPWFRTVLTGLVGLLVALAIGRRIPDVNTPLRAYRPSAIAQLLETVPENALVPHVHFSLAERRLGFTVRYVRVESIPRRGATHTGTMWGELLAAPKLPPKRLREFSRKAIGEVWRVSLKPGRSRL